MFDATRNDQEFPRLQLDHAIAKLDPHSPAPNEKHFVFVLVMMPKEFAFKLYDLHFLPVQFAHDLRPPVFREGRKLFRQSYLFHPRQHTTLDFVPASFGANRYLATVEIANVINPQTTVIRIIATIKMPSANRSTRCIRRTPRVRSAQ